MRPSLSIAFAAPRCLGAAVILVLLLGGTGLAHASPWWSLGVVERADCDRSYAAAAAYSAMRDTGFTSAPYVDPGFQFVTGVNGPTKVVVTVVPVDATHFWFDTFSTSSDGNSASFWRETINAQIPRVVFFDCSGPPGIPVGQNAPPFGTLAVTVLQQWKSMPDHCGGFNWCQQVAWSAIHDSGLTSNPAIASPFLIMGNNATTSVAVDCETFGGNWALISVFGSSANNDAPGWVGKISNLVTRIGCL